MDKKLTREEAEELTGVDLEDYGDLNRYLFYLTDVEVEIVDMPSRSVSYIPLRKPNACTEVL